MTTRKKILYGVQATGNGHLSRCLEFYPVLSHYADVDVLLSGIQGDLALPFPVKYRMHGWGYIFGKSGGIDYWATARSLKPIRLFRDIFSIDLSGYDMIINDFEPITAYACKWRFKNIECVALSHQASFFSKRIPRPKRKGYLAEFIFKYFAPAKRKIGLHFQNYDEGVYTPVIRKEIREVNRDYQDNEVLIYLPAYAEQYLAQKLKSIEDYNFRIFSKHTDLETHNGNIHIYPVGKENWMEMLQITSYAIMGAGFQGVSEMLYLKKKILAIPMLAQYEQECNAKALEDMGVMVVPSIDDRFESSVRVFLEESTIAEVDFPDHTDKLARQAIGLPEG